MISTLQESFQGKSQPWVCYVCTMGLALVGLFFGFFLMGLLQFGSGFLVFALVTFRVMK
jgi:hypothetical protein